jgi:hypothetical protein
MSNARYQCQHAAYRGGMAIRAFGAITQGPLARRALLGNSKKPEKAARSAVIAGVTQKY